MSFAFTDFSVMAQDAPLLWYESSTVDSLQNCQFHGGQWLTHGQSVNITNCLFERTATTYEALDGNTPCILNNLFWHGTFSLLSIVTNTLVQNNLFDNTFFTAPRRYYPSQTTNAGFNGYATNSLTVSNTLAIVYPTDVFLSNSPAYQTSWFGTYYLPTNSPLLNKGSTNANLLGLYHFTSLTNQMIESNSIVNISYAYVATDAYGNPLASNGDGIPDYIEDANGNGLVDSGEIGWNITGDLGLQVIIARPRNGSTVP
jgi:hypothetical protein